MAQSKDQKTTEIKKAVKRNERVYTQNRSPFFFARISRSSSLVFPLATPDSFTIAYPPKAPGFRTLYTISSSFPAYVPKEATSSACFLLFFVASISSADIVKSLGAFMYRKPVVEMISEEKAEEMPIDMFESTIRTIFVSSLNDVGWLTIMASPTDSYSRYKWNIRCKAE